MRSYITKVKIVKIRHFATDPLLKKHQEKSLLTIKPGITDLSSIVFSDEGDILKDSEDPDIDYNQLIRPWKSRLGIFYVDNNSILLDIKILYLTIISLYNKSFALRKIEFLLLKKNKKVRLKEKPEYLIEKIIEDFKFETPKKLPKICSLISGYFSYDSIRYIEKIPNKCKNDLKLPDVRLLRPRTLIIHDNLKKEIFYISNIFKDEKISNYKKKI